MKKLKPALIILFFATVVYAFSGGPPAGSTAAPGENARACTSCHTGTLNPDPRGRITISGVPTNYLPGQRYTVMVSVTHPDADRRRWGFQLTALTRPTNQPAGSIEATNASLTRRITGGPGRNRQYIMHTAQGTSRGMTGGMTWMFDWIAPNQDVGPVVFYAAGNAANNSGTFIGDRIYTTSVVSGAPLVFQNVTAAAGLANAGGGSGVAWGDYNGDGFPDLYIAREGQDGLFRNDGKGAFTEVAARVGLTEDAQGMAATWLDYDGDQDLDLFVVNMGQSRLYRNDGQAGFVDVTEPAGLRGQLPSYAVAVADYDGDKDLDIFMANAGPDALYRNNGDGTFTEGASVVGLADDRVGLGAAWGDFDGDGALDLFVANVGPDFLYRQIPGMGFMDVAAKAGVADTAVSYAAAWADFDRDGRPDLLVANDGPDFLYRNRGDGTFENLADQAGIKDQAMGRSAVWQDFDDDGDPDALVVNADGRGFLYLNQGSGKFSEVAAMLRIAETAPGSAAAWQDFDKDGDADLVVVNSTTLFLYRNPKS